MITPKLRWSKPKEEGHVVFPLEFEALDRMLKLDALQDWIHDLQVHYNEILQRGRHELP